MEDLASTGSGSRGDEIRRWGYLGARFDPLARIPPVELPVLGTRTPAAERLKRCYMGSVAVEFMHLPFPDRRRWIAERMERGDLPSGDPRVLELLARAELFEQILQSHYVGTKRFSLEGITSLIPFLDRAIRAAGQRGTRNVILGMSHRGRLNVMVNLLGKPAKEIFARFEDVDPQSVMGSGDVKYHLGATGHLTLEGGASTQIALVANPSHLEAIDPVVLGIARAAQDRLGRERRREVLPVLLHGDAAFAGQGIAAETLNLSELAGYSVGGALHVVLNNLIGFTTPPRFLYSSGMATDMARRLSIPIFHVNALDPDQVVRVAGLAVDYQYEFGSDVVVDLVGYRKHGHSEVDDPTTTQPRLYRTIASLPPLWESYARQCGQSPEDSQALARRIREAFDRELTDARALSSVPSLGEPAAQWAEFRGGPYDPGEEVLTGLPVEVLRDLGRRICTIPEGFRVHPKVAQGYALRRQMAAGERPVDWGMAEALALASLLGDGIGVRLSGQDTRRGTFNHRHAVLIDTQTEQEFVPLNHLWPDQSEFLVCIDTPLSEAAPLGFEYGYSREYPERLVAWEAQFGDFANGAQILIDQFLSAAEDKWGQLSGLVLLLPHGYEGQGPEHSHARLERFLQLAAHDSLQVCQPTSAAQYYHLLRRQALRRWRKPLIVLTPKSMLRHPESASSLESLASNEFERVLTYAGSAGSQRVVLSSGKIVLEINQELKRREDVNTALVSIEELYPFPEAELIGALNVFSGAREWCWLQEEPANMGALAHVLPTLQRLAEDRTLRWVSRARSGSPATGSSSLHIREQSSLIEQALAKTEADHLGIDR